LQAVDAGDQNVTHGERMRKFGLAFVDRMLKPLLRGLEIAPDDGNVVTRYVLYKEVKSKCHNGFTHGYTYNGAGYHAEYDASPNTNPFD